MLLISQNLAFLRRLARLARPRVMIIIEDKATRRVITIMRKMRKTDSMIVTTDKIRIRIRPAMLSKKGANLKGIGRHALIAHPGIRTSLGQIQTEI